MMLGPGSHVSHFRIVERIGAGGMGEVYRARDEHLDRDVALKVLPEGLLADERARRRFRREALALSRLNHPHIATVHDFATYDGTDVLVMEYVAGEPLSDRLSSGAIREAEAVRLATQLVEGLGAAHAEGIVHRGLKPANLRILPDGRLEILDFGLAALRQPADGETETRTMTAEGTVAGTLPYMAPERLRGESTDARTDIYAVGVTLYEMVTGQRPFHDTSTLWIAEAILHEPRVPPSRLAHRLSPPLEQIILKCVEKDAGLRYQSATDLLVELRRLSAGRTSPLTGTAAGSVRRRGGGRRWAMAAGVAGIAVWKRLCLSRPGTLGIRFRAPGRPITGVTSTRTPLMLPIGRMTEMEARLDVRGFVRVNRSAIVNIERVQELVPGRGEYLVRLTDGHGLKLTRSYREKLETRLGDRL